jgi:DNA adenine methylase Dam
MKKLKTPLRYPGGKSRAIKFLFSPENLPSTITSYREPFLGGGSCAIAFTKMFPKTPVWVNDKYYNLFCFWVTLQKHGKRLSEELFAIKEAANAFEDKIQPHKDLFLESRDRLNEATDPFEIARLFFIINKCSFSGLTESSGFSKMASQSNFSFSGINNLPHYQTMIKNWKITNEDYAALLENTEDNDFVLCDPPYDIKSFLYGKNGNMHSGFDHVLFEERASASNANVMVTYNSNDKLKEMFSIWNQVEWDLTYTFHSSKNYRKDESNRKELLLLNYSQNVSVNPLEGSL